MALKGPKVTKTPVLDEEELEEGNEMEIGSSEEQETGGEMVQSPQSHSKDLSAPGDFGVALREDQDAFDDLDKDIGFGSFPMVKLEDGKFITSDGDEFEWMDLVLQRAKRKRLYKARPNRSDDDEVPFVYSYDGVTAVDGTPLTQVAKQWLEEEEMPEGGKPIFHEYLEVLAEVKATSEKDSELDFVILNVAPASKRRLAGYQVKLRVKGLKLSQVVTRIVIGPKITKGPRSFRPWDFKLVGTLAEAK